jgi:D-3-phosphoglycerate dehydrogenase
VLRRLKPTLLEIDVTRPTVFLPEPIAAAGMDLLRDACDCLAPWAEGKTLPAAELRALLAEANAVVVRLFAIAADDLARAVRLKVIAKHGVGVDSIDVRAATARRIPVVFTPTANANAVAEHAIGLMLALARHVAPLSESLRAGRFQDRDRLQGVELASKTLGVVGLGRIGRRVAEIAGRGFGMDVRAYDPYLGSTAAPEGVRMESSLENLLREADFVTLHLPLAPETRHLVNADRLRLLKPTCRIINTSRGGVIDEAALAAALAEGRIAGAALDVFEQEPLPADHVFLSTPNTLLTPHISSSTGESLDRMARDAAQGALDVLHGRKPTYVVNPEVLSIK